MKRVKGFTLIELIVVLAIFSIIMFAATSLMTPASKIMTNAENMENGSAAVSSISKYLETELSTAEYLKIYGERVVDENDLKNKVAEFAGTYYGGVLQAESDPDSPVYGNGIVHVLQFDNSNDGKITKWDYKIKSFEAEKNAEGNYYKVDTANVELMKDSYLPVNKAYYDSYNFTIIPGTIQNIGNFDEVYQCLKRGEEIWNDTDSNGAIDTGEQTDFMQTVLDNIKASSTAFSIRATRKEKCKVCGADYHMDENGKMICNCSPSTTPRQFVNVAAMSLVNIYKRAQGGVAGHYFVVKHIPATGSSSEKNVIVDRATVPLDGYIDIVSGYKYVPSDGSIADQSKKVADGLTFIYSYGSEQDTSAP